jgi:hypothetical protein
MSGRVLLAAVVSLSLVGTASQLSAAKEQSAVAYVKSIYADRGSPGAPARYSPRLQKLWDECELTAKKNGDACMDFSMIVMGNDALLSDVHAKLIKGDAKSAVVDARFRNFGKATTVTYDLHHDKLGWMIDEMRSGCYVLSLALKGELPSC